ncbi:alkaline-phosphatase-like protein [Pyronema omphalodes]|nr:alkaline-phosphatase-like protein [Pyronema omphalodes]
MASNEPLLSARPSSEISHDNEDGYSRGSKKPAQKRADWIRIGLGVWASVATIGAILAIVVCSTRIPRPNEDPSFPPKGKRNVVFMVSDGMGPASLHLTRSYRQHVAGLPWGDSLTLDKHLIGSSRTRSSSSLVTDSAAGATAFSCGLKSYNGAISVLPDGSPCGTVLEAAKLAGYKTGLVVTTRLTDATPACFSAHVNLRSEEDRIAEQQLGDYPLGQMVDLMLGGGRCHFLPNTTAGSCRADNRDLVKEAKKKGFHYAESRNDFDKLKKGKGLELPVLGLFASTDIPYEIDRKDEDYPSLDEMTEVALNALEEATKDSDKGFFLMVEGSRIDHAGHGNDPAAQVHEVLGYDKTFKRILDWVEKHDAVLVSTSDHETGGLAMARQLHDTYPEYLWYPQVLGNASHSSEYLAARYREYTGTGGKKEDEFLKTELLEKGFGVHDVSDEEIEKLKAHKAGADWVFADIISRRAQIGWSTHGHSGVDVNIYGSKGTEKLRGNHENTEIGEFLAEYLSVDVHAVTKILKEKGVGKQDWMGKGLEQLQFEALAKEQAEGKPGNVVLGDHFHKDEIDAYHGDFRKRCVH